MIRHSLLLFAALSFLMLPVAHAQSATASMFGVVRDTTGASVAGATVTATETQTGLERTAQSDATGGYLFTNLPVGQYQLRVTASGFRAFVQKGIPLDVSANARVDAKLSLGELTQTVEVTGQAIGVDTRSATVGELVDRARVEELPLNGRNSMQLAQVVPGVTNILAAPTVQTQSRSGPSITVSGGRDTQNEFRLDGVSWKNITQNTGLNLPNPDALQEFQILTSSASAEYGRNSGGIILAVTRSGTNDLHVSAWEYLRNTALNARNYFVRAPIGKPQLIQNQFGFTAGGPVIHNKLFAFGSYQGTRIRQSQILSSAVPPTQAQRNGNFGTQTLKNVRTGAVYAGQIPATDFDPVAVKLLNAFVPLAPSGALVQLVSSPTNDYQYLVRGDYTINAKNNFSSRYFRERGSVLSQAGNVSPYDPDVTGTLSQTLAASDTQIITSNMLNEARIGVERVDSTVTETGHQQLSDFGAVFPGVITPQLPNISVSGFFSLANTDLFVEHDNLYQLDDTIRWNRGKHAISFGGELERLELYNFGSSGNNGTFTFNGTQSGNAFADFLLGTPVTLTQASPYQRNAKTWDGYLFGEDDIQLAPRLTVSLGLRYSIFQPFGITGNHTNTYRQGQQSTVVPNAPPGMVFPGDAGVQNGLVPTDYHNLAPRVGLAFDPRGDGKTSLRAAYGLFFEDFRSDVWTYPAVNQPFVVSNTVNTPYSLQDPYHGQVDPFPYHYSPTNAQFTFPMSLFTVPTPTFNSPYVHNLSASVQHEMNNGLVFKVAYVGKLEHNLVRMLQNNPAVYGPGATLANTNSRRVLLPGIYGSFRYICTCSDAAYESLQASLGKRYTNGFTFMFTYTFGKLEDYYSATNLGQTPQNPYNMRSDWGRSDFDRRHVFNASVVYAIPFFHEAPTVARYVFGHWQASTIVGASSGLPFSATTGSDASLTGVGYDRPNVVGIPFRNGYSSRTDELSNYFNTAAFVKNNPGQYGNAGRNILTGPGLTNASLTLVRDFPISDKLGKLQFRSEVFNIFNHPNFGQPDGVLADKTFGQILTTGTANIADPRIVQFAIKYQF